MTEEAAIIERAFSRNAKRKARKQVNAVKAQEPKPEPKAPEEFVAPEIRHEDDRIIPGLTGRGTVLRLDTLAKLLEGGKISHVQYSAGRDYLGIVENYFANASGLAKLSDEAGRVGGDGDPIRRYIRGRREYLSTQRPRNPPTVRAHSDGWTGTKLAAMEEFSRMARLVAGLPRDPQTALCLLVVDPTRPDLAPLSMGAACARLFGNSGTASYTRLTRWLREALDEVDATLMADQRMAA